MANVITNNLGLIESAAGGAVVGGVVGGAVGYAVGKKRTKKAKSSNRKKRTHAHKRTRKTPHTAGKRKDTSRRRIRYTKKGQPYVIGAKGKARFISKASAKRSRKLKGGRY